MAKSTANPSKPANTERRNVKSPAQPVDGHERGRDFLTATEMDLLLKSARAGRFGIRDYAMLLLTYRHGLRAPRANMT